MPSRLVFVLVAVAAIVSWLWWTRNSRSVVDPESHTPRLPTKMEPSVELFSADPHDSVDEPGVSVETQRTVVENAPASATPALRRSRLAEIRGRFVLEGGGPAAGVPCSVTGWVGDQERELKYGVPVDWKGPTGVTDGEGRLSISFDPPRAFQFTFEAKVKGYAGAEWRWGEIEPGAVIDLGEVPLMRGGTLAGRIVDRAGNTLIGQDWWVHARSIGLSEWNGRSETQVITHVNPDTGRYRAEDVMPGRVSLKASSHIANGVEAPPFSLQASETLTVDMVYEGPANSRRITVVTFAEPFSVMGDPKPEHIRLFGAGPDPRFAQWIEGSSQGFSFDDLDPGSYTIEIDDPRYIPWKRSGVTPGSRIDAHLEGASALHLAVIDTKDRSVQPYTVRAQLRNVEFQPDTFEIVPENSGLLTGMLPGDYTITVRAGELLGAIAVDGLTQGETRSITVRLGSGSVVAGRVQYSDGVPASGVDIALLTAIPEGREGRPPFEWSVADRVMCNDVAEKESTDEDGAFRFSLARPGEYLLYASMDSRLDAVSEKLVLTSNSGLEGIMLVLPRGGTAAGRVLAPQGTSCAGLRVWIGSETESIHGMRSISEEARELGADGRFEIRSIRPGPAAVYLLLPVQRRLDRSGGLFMLGGLNDHIMLGTLDVVDGRRIERDFQAREFPGTVALSVLVNGAVVAGLQVELSKGGDEKRSSVIGRTDARGWFGPALAFPGLWTVSVEDLDVGWQHVDLRPVLITAASESQAQVSIQVIERRVQFLDVETGTALCNRLISLFCPPANEWTADLPLARRRTDSEGRASWTLTSGEYRFRLESEDEEGESWSVGTQGSGKPARTAHVTWTLEGCLVREVRL